MIHFSWDSAQGLATVTLAGQLSQEDIQQVTPKLDETIADQGAIRVLLNLVDFDGWDGLHAAWNHFTLVKNHHHAIDRIAVVGNRRWEQALAAMVRPFVHATQRYFDETQQNEAYLWVTQTQPTGVRL